MDTKLTKTRDTVLNGIVRHILTAAGATEFDLGNSPREYIAEIVAGKNLITTTTNGTRACANAEHTLVASFLNLTATTDFLRAKPPENLVVVCSGTYEETALEDALGAGAVADELWDLYGAGADDSEQLARQLFTSLGDDLEGAMRFARNGRRLLSLPDLAGDVACCARRDVYSFASELVGGSSVRKLG